MAKLIKTIMGGIVARNVKLQVFLEPKTYLELVNEAKHYGIVAKTDSDLVNKCLKLLFDELPAKIIQLEEYKKALLECRATNKLLQDKK